jgi:hypothetical protein
MNPKLLFILGIIVAHGAVAASWARFDMPKERVALSQTCPAGSSAPLPDFTPRAMLWAFNVDSRSTATELWQR